MIANYVAAHPSAALPICSVATFVAISVGVIGAIGLIVGCLDAFHFSDEGYTRETMRIGAPRLHLFFQDFVPTYAVGWWLLERRP